MTRNRRATVKIVEPMAFLRLSLPFFLLLISNLTLLIFVSLKSSAFVSEAEMQNPEMLFFAQSLVTKIIKIILIGNFAIGCLCLLLWFITSHRLLGPVIPIRRQIKSLIDGNYENKIVLRQSDEFKNIAEDLNKLTDTLKNSRGQGLIQVLISIALMGILMVGITTVLEHQARENKALGEKLAGLDLQKAVTAVLADGSVCTFQVGQLPLAQQSFDATPLSTGGAVQDIDLGNTLLTKADATAPAIVTVNQPVSPIATTVVANKIAITNIKCPSPCPNPLTSNIFTANLQISFDTSKMVRSIVPATSQLILTTSDASGQKKITSCTASSGSGGPASWKWGYLQISPPTLVKGTGIASVTQVGGSTFRVNFATPMPDTNYVVVLTPMSHQGLSHGQWFTEVVGARTLDSFQFYTINWGGMYPVGGVPIYMNVVVIP